jgi:ABC-type multidrug transport system ATPase subunit
MIHIHNASIAYGREILFKGLTLHVPPATMNCITGASGKGKSSLLNAIMGFTPLQEGSVTINNLRLSQENISTNRNCIAWLPQEVALPAEWVREMIETPFLLKANQSNPFSKIELLSYFEALGLDRNLYDKRVREVSGGQRQRIMLAVAALLHKKIIIVDEPTSALDPASVEKVIIFLKSLSKKGVTILAVSHDERFIAACDHTYTL